MGSRALERSGHRVVAYDARAHGKSDGGDDYSYDRLAADLLAVLDDRQIDTAVFAGASMGAHTLTTFALKHPDRVAGLVIMTPAYSPERDPGLERWDRLAAGLRNGGVEGFVEAYGTPDVPEKWHETINRVLHQRLSAHDHPDALADAIQAVPRSRPFEDWGDLAADPGADGRRRQPRRGRPRAPVRGRRALRGGDPARPARDRGRGRFPARLAGRAGLQGHRGGGGLCGKRAMSSSAHSTTSSRS